MDFLNRIFGKRQRASSRSSPSSQSSPPPSPPSAPSPIPSHRRRLSEELPLSASDELPNIPLPPSPSLLSSTFLALTSSPSPSPSPDLFSAFHDVFSTTFGGSPLHPTPPPTPILAFVSSSFQALCLSIDTSLVAVFKDNQPYSPVPSAPFITSILATACLYPSSRRYLRQHNILEWVASLGNILLSRYTLLHRERSDLLPLTELVESIETLLSSCLLTIARLAGGTTRWTAYYEVPLSPESRRPPPTSVHNSDRAFSNRSPHAMARSSDLSASPPLTLLAKMQLYVRTLEVLANQSGFLTADGTTRQLFFTVVKSITSLCTGRPDAQHAFYGAGGFAPLSSMIGWPSQLGHFEELRASVAADGISLTPSRLTSLSYNNSPTQRSPSPQPPPTSSPSQHLLFYEAQLACTEALIEITYDDPELCDRAFDLGAFDRIVQFVLWTFQNMPSSPPPSPRSFRPVKDPLDTIHELRASQPPRARASSTPVQHILIDDSDNMLPGPHPPLDCADAQVFHADLQLCNTPPYLQDLLSAILSVCVSPHSRPAPPLHGAADRYVPYFARGASSLRMLSNPVVNMERVPLEFRLVQVVFDLFDESIGSHIPESNHARRLFRSDYPLLQQAALDFLKRLVGDRPQYLAFCRANRMYDMLFSPFFYFVDEPFTPTTPPLAAHPESVAPAPPVTSLQDPPSRVPPRDPTPSCERTTHLLKQNVMHFVRFAATVDDSPCTDEMLYLTSLLRYRDTNLRMVLDVTQSMVSIIRHRATKARVALVKVGALPVFCEVVGAQTLRLFGPKPSSDDELTPEEVAAEYETVPPGEERDRLMVARDAVLRTLDYLMDDRLIRLHVLLEFYVVNLLFGLINEAEQYREFALRCLIDVAAAVRSEMQLHDDERDFLSTYSETSRAVRSASSAAAPTSLASPTGSTTSSFDATTSSYDAARSTIEEPEAAPAPVRRNSMVPGILESHLASMKKVLLQRYVETIPSHTRQHELVLALLQGVRRLARTDSEQQIYLRRAQCMTHVTHALAHFINFMAIQGVPPGASPTQFAVAVLDTLTELLRQNPANKERFVQDVGYDLLHTLLLKVERYRPSRRVFSALFDMLVDGEFDLRCNSVIRNPDVIRLMFKLLPYCSAAYKVTFFSTFIQVVSGSALNQVYCCSVNLVDDILDQFDGLPRLDISAEQVAGHASPGLAAARPHDESDDDDNDPAHPSPTLQQSASRDSALFVPPPSPAIRGFVPDAFRRLPVLSEQDKDRLDMSLGGLVDPNADILRIKAIELMQLLGSHSLTVKQMKRYLRLMRPHRFVQPISARSKQRHVLRCRSPLVPALLRAIEQMTVKEGPDNFFYFDGVKSGLAVPYIDRWPASGYAISVWLRVESFAHPSADVQGGVHQPRLFCFTTEDRRGLEIFFHEGVLTVQVVSSNGSNHTARYPEVDLQPRRWYHLLFTHASRTFGSAEFSIYLNGRLANQDRKLEYPNSSAKLTRCFIATDNTDVSKQRSNSFFGQMGPIYVFEDSLSSHQARVIYEQGSSYMFTFEQILDGALTPKIALAYNAKAREDNVFLDNTPRDNRFASAVRSRGNRGMHANHFNGTHQCVTRHVTDVLHCLGGISVLFPLLSQLDLPVILDILPLHAEPEAAERDVLEAQAEAANFSLGAAAMGHGPGVDADDLTGAMVASGSAAEGEHDDEDDEEDHADDEEEGDVVEGQAGARVDAEVAEEEREEAGDDDAEPVPVSADYRFDIITRQPRRAKRKVKTTTHRRGSSAVNSSQSGMQRMIDLERDGCRYLVTYEVDPALLVNLLRALVVLLRDNAINQAFVRQTDAFAVISSVLQHVSPKHLTVEAVDAMELLVDCVSHDAELLCESFYRLFATFDIWIYAHIDVQRRWLQAMCSLADVHIDKLMLRQSHAPERIAHRVGVQHLLDQLRAYCWFEQEADSFATTPVLRHVRTGQVIGRRPDHGALREIRAQVLSLIRTVLSYRETVQLEEVRSIVYMLLHCNDHKQKTDVLKLLVELLISQPSSMLKHMSELQDEPMPEGTVARTQQYKRNSYRRQGIDVFLQLLRSPEQDVRLVSLQAIGKLLRSNYGKRDAEELFPTMYRFLRDYELTKPCYSSLFSIMLSEDVQSPLSSSAHAGLGLDGTQTILYAPVLPLIFKLMKNCESQQLNQFIMQEMSFLLDNEVNRALFLRDFGWQKWLFHLILANSPSASSPQEARWASDGVDDVGEEGEATGEADPADPAAAAAAAAAEPTSGDEESSPKRTTSYRFHDHDNDPAAAAVVAFAFKLLDAHVLFAARRPGGWRTYERTLAWLIQYVDGSGMVLSTMLQVLRKLFLLLRMEAESADEESTSIIFNNMSQVLQITQDALFMQLSRLGSSDVVPAYEQQELASVWPLVAEIGHVYEWVQYMRMAAWAKDLQRNTRRSGTPTSASSAAMAAKSSGDSQVPSTPESSNRSRRFGTDAASQSTLSSRPRLARRGSDAAREHESLRSRDDEVDASKGLRCFMFELVLHVVLRASEAAQARLFGTALVEPLIEALLALSSSPASATPASTSTSPAMSASQEQLANSVPCAAGLVVTVLGVLRTLDRSQQASDGGPSTPGRRARSRASAMGLTRFGRSRSNADPCASSALPPTETARVAAIGQAVRVLRLCALPFYQDALRAAPRKEFMLSDPSLWPALLSLEDPVAFAREALDSEAWLEVQQRLSIAFENTLRFLLQVQENRVSRFQLELTGLRELETSNQRAEDQQLHIVQQEMSEIQNAQCARETNRRAVVSGQVARDKRRVASTWKQILRSLTNERGPWSASNQRERERARQLRQLRARKAQSHRARQRHRSRAKSERESDGGSATPRVSASKTVKAEEPEEETADEERVFWKLDPTENGLRQRLRLEINYDGHSHKNASHNYMDEQEQGGEQDESGTGGTTLPLVDNMSPADASMLLKSAVKLTQSIRGAAASPSSVNSPSASDMLGADDEDWDVVGMAEEERDAPSAGQARAHTVLEIEAAMVSPTVMRQGVLTLTASKIFFETKEVRTYDKKRLDVTDAKACMRQPKLAKLAQDHAWAVEELRNMYMRKHQLRPNSLELFFEDQTNYFFQFNSERDRQQVAKKLLRLPNPNLRVVSTSRNPMRVFRKSGVLELWRRRQISNFEYLMFLNTLAGRTYNDLSQYPVFPWVLSDYTSETLDLNDERVYRDLSKPVGALNEQRLRGLLDRYEGMIDDPDMPKFMYGTHYSNSGIVLFYLVRMEPFTTQAILMQDGHFDYADRMFDSIPNTWHGVLNNQADVKELIPEFFYQPEFLRNSNGLNMGRKQSTGRMLGDVELPPWASSPEEFVRINREALESEYVSQHLHEWIDLIFGFKQRGRDAVEAANVFFHLTYEGAVNVDAIEDPHTRDATISQIEHFGQTPSQLLREPHPVRCEPGMQIPTIFMKLSEVQLYRRESIPQRQKSESNPLLFIGHCSDRILTVDLDRHLLIHRWDNCTPEFDPPFSFGVERRSKSAKPRQIGVHFAVGLLLMPHSFALARDERLLFSSGHWDNSFKASAVESGRTVQSISQHKDIVTCIAVSADGQFLVTGSKDTTVMVWRVNPQNQGADPTHLSPATAALFASGLPIAETPRHVLYGHDDEVTCVACSVDLDLVVSASRDGTCILHTLRAGRYVRSIYPPCGRHLRWVGIARNGHIVVHSASSARELHVYTINGRLVQSISAGERILAHAFSRDSKFIVTGGEKYVTVRYLHNLKVAWKDAKWKENRPKASVRSLVISPDEQHLFVGLQSTELLIYALNADRLRERTLQKLATLGF